jgi:hypothetical protein
MCCNVYSDPPSFSLDNFLTNYITSNPHPSYFMTIPLSCVVLFGLRSGWSRAIASSGTHLWSYRISSEFVSLHPNSVRELRTILNHSRLLEDGSSHQRELEPGEILVVGSDTQLYTFLGLFERFTLVQDKLARNTMCTLGVFGVME